MRRTRKSHDTADLLRSLTVIGPGELSEADKVQLVRSLRGQGEEVDTEIDRFLVHDSTLMRAGLLTAQSSQASLRKKLEKLDTSEMRRAQKTLDAVESQKMIRRLMLQG